MKGNFVSAKIAAPALAAMLAATVFCDAPVQAQQGPGPRCDFQFLRNARRRARVCVCFQRVNGARQLCCIDVDGIVGPVPPGLPTTPAEMAAAMCNAINNCPPAGSLVCVNPGPDICCTMAGPHTVAVKLWTVASRDGAGGLIANVGPGPTNPANPNGPPPPPQPGMLGLPPMLHLIGVPASPATIFAQAFGGPLVQVPVAPGTTADVAAQSLANMLNAAGYQAAYLGPTMSFLNDRVEIVELRALPGGAGVEKILLLSYDEDLSNPAPGPSNLGIGVELEEETEVTSYCTAKNGLFCGVPSLAATGVSSASSPTGFVVSAQPARENRLGILLYTNAGRAAVPFHGGLLCLKPPLRRSVPVNSRGASICTGVFALDVNCFASGGCGGNPAPFLSVPGTLIQCQFWGRDTFMTGDFLSDGGEWLVGP